MQSTCATGGWLELARLRNCLARCPAQRAGALVTYRKPAPSHCSTVHAFAPSHTDRITAKACLAFGFRYRDKELRYDYCLDH